MRKVLLGISFLSVLAPSAIFAGYGTAGCGMGSLAFQENGKWQQVLAATTNGTFGTQTFGITTGTSNCSTDGAVKSEREKEVFIATNFESLHEEIAKGSGEKLATLSHLMGCPRSSTDTFAKVTQSNYEASISKAQSPEQLLAAIEQNVSANHALAQACSL